MEAGKYKNYRWDVDRERLIKTGAVAKQQYYTIYGVNISINSAIYCIDAKFCNSPCLC